ncbi:MAG: aspartate kinase [Verrucomicrobiales bacterium]|nr:aspartate kinase [Verrucomicrobiales bacterium]
MSIVVQKYGGSSVATPEKLREVAKRVIETRDSGHSVVVVVSAMADTTDDLLSLSKKVSISPERRELDMLLTAGERISMALLSMAIRELGGKAISFTGSQAGIITNDRHVDARIIEVRPIRVQDELERGNIVIVAGYQGMSYRREITTLGRGGSDTTAVALAAALDAEWCEICSDVDGVYTADPRVVPAAHRIPEMDYEETKEMADNGAKVLNAQAVEFASENGIAIYARATSGPIPDNDPIRDGTVVRKFPPRESGSVTGIASQKEIIIMKGATVEIEEVLKILSDFEIDSSKLRIDRSQDGRFNFLVTVTSENLHQIAALEGQLAIVVGDSFRIKKGLGAVSVIGSGINAQAKNVMRGSRVLGTNAIIEVVTSPRRITWIVNADRVDEATRTLHGEFLEN